MSTANTEKNFKTQMCRWHLVGKCKNGDACGYAHSTFELRGATDANKRPQPAPSKKEIQLPSVPKCVATHAPGETCWNCDKYKTSLCAFWTDGCCAAGAACRFAHGAHELRRATALPATATQTHTHTAKVPPPPAPVCVSSTTTATHLPHTQSTIPPHTPPHTSGGLAYAPPTGMCGGGVAFSRSETETVASYSSHPPSPSPPAYEMETPSIMSNRHVSLDSSPASPPDYDDETYTEIVSLSLYRVSARLPVSPPVVSPTKTYPAFGGLLVDGAYTHTYTPLPPPSVSPASYGDMPGDAHIPPPPSRSPYVRY